MNNVIEACIRNKCKLVFFDNVYMYGKVDGAMTEDSPVNPISKKGEVRAHIAEMLMSTADSGEIDALIVRSADFYGPKAFNSASYMMVLDKLKNRKKASWIINDKVIHSATFTPDAAKGTALLGNTADTYNQIWHLPTDPEPITGKQFVELAAEAFGVEARYNVLSMWMMKMVGLFNSDVKEILEMMYQQEFDYYFDSSKFNNRFFQPTNYRAGLKICANEMLKK
jgi:nucleoside-diphosphate-sugar epimerase